MCVLLQIKELKTENNGLKVEMDKREIEVQRLKEKVCGCGCGCGADVCLCLDVFYMCMGSL